MNMISLIEEAKNFKGLEKEIYIDCCKEACEKMQRLLEEKDLEIMKTRDKKRFRLKNSSRENTIITLMGEVTYKRRYYRCIDEDGVIYYGYLLDEMLGIDNKDKLSDNVKETAVETALRQSYRKSAEAINRNNQYSISPQTIWKEVQKAGEKAKALENHLVKKYLKGELKGEKEVPVLFEEKDGVYLSIQGEKGKKEIKVSKVYEGWKKKTPGSKEYKTVNRIYTAGFEDGSSFDCRVNSKIANIYNMDKIKNKIINADGATWTKKEQEYDASIIQQLDLFHIHEAILRKIINKKKASKIRKYVKNNDYENVFIVLEDLYSIERNGKEREKIFKLMTYLSQNQEFLIRYTERGLDLPKGIEYRGMGTIEGSQHNVICDRMKNRGMSWSIPGADNMAKLLCLKHSSGLSDVFEAVLPLDEGILDLDINRIIEMNYKEKEKRIRNSLKGTKTTASRFSCQTSPIPFTGCKVTNGRKAIRNMVKDTYVSDLSY